ncbi:hypothetical protein EDD18DRAFT_1359549 [Armillaria luteobubalina]|uniref:Uncharacterized protein n=1 Tax=Armillaria luteobubalina TaxID=153913 RepID=A0AA39UHY9_9AGAR|nr:hypothetical protein EDD18DRAFT_1359549 [Armillaria luteobubalina]
MPLVMTDYAITSEVVFVYLMSGLGLQNTVEEIELVNWPAQKVHGYRGPFNQLCPILTSVSPAACYTFLKELLGPRTQVSSLSLRHVDHGYISIPPEVESPPSDTDMLDAMLWLMCHGLNDNDQHNMRHPPSLRKLCIKFSSVHYHSPCTIYHIGHALHDQLFATQAMVTNLMRIVPSDVNFLLPHAAASSKNWIWWLGT